MDNLLRSKLKGIFGTDLAPSQEVIFNAMSNLNYATFRLARGGGKDFLIAAYALLYAESEAGSRILITAPTFIQAKINFNELQKPSLISNFKDMLLKIPTVCADCCYLKFKNNSIIEVVALNDLGVRSAMDSDVVFVNESDSALGQQLEKLVVGVENGDLKKVFLMSTGYRDYNYMNKIEAHECFSTHAFGYKSFPSGFYDQSNINEAKTLLSSDEFDMQYNAKIC